MFLPITLNGMKAVTARKVTARTVLRAGAVAIAVGLAIPAAASDHPSIRATREDGSVRLEIERVEDDRRLTVFRSVEPFASQPDLDTASEVTRLRAGEAEFVDTAPSGLPWYYGVFTQRELEDSEPQFVEGENVTDEPVRIPLAEEPRSIDADDQHSRPRRGRPLPRLNPDHSAITGEPLPPSALPSVSRRPVEPETESAIERLLERASNEEDEEPEVIILREEQTRRRSANAQTLQQIVRATIETERWEDAVDYLTSLLVLSLSPEVEQRAHFYLGQAYYFRNAPRRAVLYLLQANDTYHAESRTFIDAALSALADE